MAFSLTHSIALTLLYQQRQRMLREVLNHYPDPTQAWLNVQLPGKEEALKKAQEEQAFIARHGIATYYLHDTNYPPLLKECADAPILLYAKGNINLTDGYFISVVGTRQPTERGKQITRELILSLADKLPNLTIVSGLAYGIDITAHRAAMEAGIPTIIIPAHGLDRIYPAIHRNDAIRALENGGILTEYPSGTTPEKRNFIARNRIIAGLSHCTIVTESRRSGGSLITASMAFEYGRPVFAIPGRPSDDNAAGCNHLIRDQKAVLLQEPDDLIDAMMWQKEDKPIQTSLYGMGLMSDSDKQTAYALLSNDEQTIMHLLNQAEDGILANDIADETGLPYGDIITTLMTLELKHFVKSYPGGLYRAL